MKMVYPEKSLLRKTGPVDYYDWNYKFPIKYVQRYRFETILRLMGSAKYDSLLEVGMGSGIFLPELSKHCKKLFGCDIHPEIEHITKLLKVYDINNYEISTQSIEHTNYPNNYFDLIVSVSVLEFVENLQSAINEIKRILKEEGVFMTICPMQSGLLDAFLSIYSQKKPAEEFGEARLIVGKTLEESFKVVKKGYMMPFIGSFFPVYTHYLLKK